MGRDFARKGRQQNKRVKKQSSSHWSWLLAGTVIGMLLTTLAVFKLMPVIYPIYAQSESEKATNLQIAKTKSETKTKEIGSNPTKFDFYSLLPELEVTIPENKPKPVLPQTQTQIQTQTQTKPETHTPGYRLQLASFRNFKDADRLKAQMALTGIQVEIEAVTLAENETWYRVRSILFPDRATAESAKNQLQAQSIKSLLVEEKG